MAFGLAVPDIERVRQGLQRRVVRALGLSESDSEGLRLRHDLARRPHVDAPENEPEEERRQRDDRRRRHLHLPKGASIDVRSRHTTAAPISLPPSRTGTHISSACTGVGAAAGAVVTWSCPPAALAAGSGLYVPPVMEGFAYRVSATMSARTAYDRPDSAGASPSLEAGSGSPPASVPSY